MLFLTRGEIEYDKYDREIVCRARGIATVELLQVVDQAEEKRVELHLHTNMSSMDGINTAGDLINRAYKWGQPAIAITDHGVAQAFPDAMNAVNKIRKNGGEFKVIYGVEAYFVNDMVPALTGESRRSLDDEFICFDVETTGLSPNTDRLTEIGAVKLKTVKLLTVLIPLSIRSSIFPKKNTQLTGITDDMVKDAPSRRRSGTCFLRVLRNRCGFGCS